MVNMECQGSIVGQIWYLGLLFNFLLNHIGHIFYKGIKLKINE